MRNFWQNVYLWVCLPTRFNLASQTEMLVLPQFQSCMPTCWPSARGAWIFKNVLFFFLPELRAICMSRKSEKAASELSSILLITKVEVRRCGDVLHMSFEVAQLAV